MLAVNRIVGSLSLLAISSALLLTGCGDSGAGNGDETVFLYVTNGYPGSSDLTLYGPSSKLVDGLAFGKRSEAIEVNRNVNSEDFLLVLDGAPAEIQFNKPLFSMYPQETGTLIISRRASETTADATLYRHTRSPDPDCTLTFGNSLSVANNLLPDQLLSYSYQTEWNVNPAPYYVESAENFATTRCGYTAVPARYKRPDIHTAIANDPWFFPVSGDNVAGGFEYSLVWARRQVDPRTNEPRSEGFTLNGQIVAEPTTRDFVECLSSAVTIVQEQTQGGGAAGAEQECPDPQGSQTGPDGETVYAEDQVAWNEETVLTCFDEFTYSGFSVEVGQPDTIISFGLRPNQDQTCGFPVRVRTPHQDIIFQNVNGNTSNYVEEGGFIEIDTTFPMSEHHFFVLFGRPINAWVDQWNSEETAVSLEDYPYPGGELPPYATTAN